MSSVPSEQRVAGALENHAWTEQPALPGRTNHRRAGVLVPLRWTASSLQVILTERAAHLGRHAGEYAFPGGKPEPEDSSLEATALREAREEIGLEGARPLGRLSSLPLYTSDFRLEPFVAAVPAEAQLEADPNEVSTIVELDLAELLGRASWPAIPWTAGDDRQRLSPCFELEPGAWREALVYGGTAHALHELLAVLAPEFGRTLPPLRPASFDWGDVFASRSSAKGPRS
ncbi:MAG: CoA pyrophosphatase [Myxococcota bacterium]